MHIDDKPTYRMSASGYCPRRLGCIQLGLESESAPRWLEKSANEGNWHERRIKDELVEQGFQVFDEQLELRIATDNIELVGHIDGKVRTPDKVVQLLEIKSMSQYEFDRWMKGGFDAFPQYLAQIACYFAGTGLPECLYIVKNRNSGYVDTRVIKPMPGYFNSILGNLTEVANSVSEGNLFPAEFNPDSLECKRCSYKLLCVPKVTELDIATRQQLDMAVAQIRDGNKLIAKGKELYDKGKSTLYKHTIASNLKKWQHNELAVLLVNVKEQTTYPKEALLAKYGEQELSDIANVKEAYSYLRLNDLLENKE